MSTRFSRKILPSIGENIALRAIWTRSRVIKVASTARSRGNISPLRASQVQEVFTLTHVISNNSDVAREGRADVGEGGEGTHSRGARDFRSEWPFKNLWEMTL